MSMQFRLPDLGEGITEAELVRWLVKPGDKVALDQEVAEVQTDKAIVELPSPIEGTVLELNVAEGQLVPVRTVLLTIGEETQEMPPAGGVAQRDGLGKIETQAPRYLEPSIRSSTSVTVLEATNGKRGKHVLATPVARRMARELGIDITTIIGSGSAGRVRTEDVQKQAMLRETDEHTATKRIENSQYGGASTALPGETEQDEERIPLRGLRRRIAENMVISTSTIPQVTSMVEVDATGLVELRRSISAAAEEQGVKLSYLPFIVKAIVHALHLYPYVNATIEGEQIVLKHTYHIGIATATPDGLLVPVLRSADQLTVLEIAREVNRLAEAARERKLQLHELRGSSFTISNYGTIGGFFTTPIINPGEAGILGLGKIVKRPWVVDDRVEVRSVLPLSFTSDHRLIDGELVMRFLNTLIASLENPNLLLINMR